MISALHFHDLPTVFGLHRLEYRSVANHGIFQRCAGHGRLVAVQIVQEIVHEFFVAAAVTASRANHIPVYV